MGLAQFDEFVRREQEKVQATVEQNFDPQKEKEEWLQYLEKLYRLVSTYLDGYVRAGQITIQYRPLSLNEEYVGDYTVREMVITVGTKVIRLEPVGTFLIGSKGRVDVLGPVARARLLLMDSRITRAQDMVRVSVSVNGGPPSPSPSSNETYPIEWAWRLITRPPQREIMELNKETFLKVLLEIGNG